MVCLIVALVPLVTVSQPLPPNTPQSNNISAMVLLYMDARDLPGGYDRPRFSVEQLQSVIGYTVPSPTNSSQQHAKDYLFDAALFIGYEWKGNKCFWPGSCAEPMNLTDFQELHTLWLHEGATNLNAATQLVVGNVSGTNVSDHRRTRVVVTIPYPDMRAQHFGRCCDGFPNPHDLNMSVHADRLLAVQWWIDTTVKFFELSRFEYVELSGVYWFLEDLPEDDIILLPQIASYLRRRAPNIKFTWIPYFQAAVSSVSLWRRLGFDWVTIQPNYAFQNVSNAAERFGKVNELMNQYNCGIEMELPLEVQNPAINRSVAASFDAYMKFSSAYGWGKNALKTFYYGNEFIQMALSRTGTPERNYYERIYRLLRFGDGR